MKFRILAGTHSISLDSEVKVYRTGDVIESDENLVAKFANKFEQISDDAKTSDAKATIGKSNKASIKKQKEEQEALQAEEEALLNGDDEEDAEEEADETAEEETSEDADESPDSEEEADEEDEGDDEEEEDEIDFELASKKKGEWFVVKTVNGKKTKEKMNDEPLTKGEARKLMREIKKTLA